MIFLSYARADGRTYAEQLESDLNAAGFETWRDTRNLNEYNDFSAELEINIRHATFVAVVVTPSIEENPGSFVRREILYAQSKNKPIIPLIFPEATPPILINHLTFIDFQNYAAGFAELLERLKKSPQPSPQPHTDDPFRPYLRNLYDWIVSYLEKTVFALITLRAEATPDAVRDSALLPMTFLDTFSTMAGINTEPEKTTYHNIHQAFEKYQGRMLLLGEPGAGKTTTLMAFAREMITKRLENPALPLPILAPIVTWDAEKQTPLADWLSSGYPDFKTDIARQIQQGKALLLLDGLDELGRERENPQTKERYDPRQRFVKIIPDNNQLLISCRIKDYEEIGEKLALNGAVTLQPLDDSQMKDYLRDLPDLSHALEKNGELREVVRTPILLNFLRKGAEEVEITPETFQDLDSGELRDRIFEIYVEGRYKHESRKPNANLPYFLEYMLSILSEVAMQETMFSAGDMRSENIIFNDYFYIGAAPFDTAPFIEQAIRLNIFIKDNEGNIRFIHLLLRNYFALKRLIGRLGARTMFYHDVRALGRMNDLRATQALINASGRFGVESSVIADTLLEIGTPEAIKAGRNWYINELLSFEKIKLETGYINKGYFNYIAQRVEKFPEPEALEAVRR